jgi:drug/metabolite transporter (DMT)-like permease
MDPATAVPPQGPTIAARPDGHTLPDADIVAAAVANGATKSGPAAPHGGPPASAYVALATMPFFFGMTFAVTKFALRGFQPLQLCLVRFVVAGAILLLLWRLRRHRERLTWADMKQLALLGFVSLTVYFTFETLGIARTSASEASIIIASIPVFVSVLAAVFLKERNAPLQWAGVALSFAGVIALVMLGGASGQGALAGNLLVLGAALAASVYQLLARRFLVADRSALYLTAFQNLFGALFMAPLAAVELALVGARRPTLEAGLGVGYLILFSSVLAYLLLNYGLRFVPASRASTFVNLTPIVAVVGAYVLLGERFTIGQGLAAVVVVAGVWLANRRGVAERTVRALEEG